MYTYSGRERGLVLITALILLLVMTLLGLAAIQNTLLEERMAGNFRAQSVAFQSAEASLRAGETWLGGLVDQPGAVSSSPNPSNSVWILDGPDADGSNGLMWYLESTRGRSWWANNGIAYASVDQLRVTASETLAEAPRHVVEQAGFVADSLVVGQQQATGRWFYQITSRGEAPGGRGEALLRSTFARRF
jgi:type IV pilus assembly protein PilX